MRDILQVAEAGQPDNFARKQSHPTVTWTFAADDSSRLSTCRGNLRSSTYDRISTSRSQESEGQNFCVSKEKSSQNQYFASLLYPTRNDTCVMCIFYKYV